MAIVCRRTDPRRVGAIRSRGSERSLEVLKEREGLVGSRSSNRVNSIAHHLHIYSVIVPAELSLGRGSTWESNEGISRICFVKENRSITYVQYKTFAIMNGWFETESKKK